ncbi:adipocyte plasma membrane-associated protein-like [Saccoglossus kowalevskii]|uniref:Adipocyte plasma membrane-associated protein-like n=1 Tax=Saccoglossus kowalevskii TaxID=10224 RepID=A0ABM0MQ45_SACKO|nr:PREDICTED: adipocyte plasma membrane-associated protein-like [Saccoglossus kowalevskii]
MSVVEGGVRHRQVTGEAGPDVDEGQIYQEDRYSSLQNTKKDNEQAKTGFSCGGVFIITCVAVAITAIIIACLPSPIKPVTFSLPDPPEFVGVLAPNNKLQDAKKLFDGEITGPESLEFHDGVMYTGTTDGRLVKIIGKTVSTLATFGIPPCTGKYEEEPRCGRPLGIRVDSNGTLYVIDAYKGLYKVDPKTGDVIQLVSSNTVVEKKKMKLGNDLDLQKDGIVYFTDSSYKWQRRQHGYLSSEAGSCGRLLWYNPVTGKAKVLLKNLHFPNGVQLSPKQDYLLVTETTRARIIKYNLKGPNRGKVEVFANNLPGLPDNIRPSSSGGYWVGMAIIRDPTFSAFDYVASRPWLRSLLLKIFDPEILKRMAPKYGLLIELNADGDIIQSLHDPTGEVIPSVSEVLETAPGQLYLGSYHSSFIGKLDLSGSHRSSSSSNKDRKQSQEPDT